MLKHQRAIISQLLFICLPSIWAASPLDGDWLGGFERLGSHVYVHTRFFTTTNGTTGTIDVVDLGDKSTAFVAWPLEKRQLPPPRVHFELADKPGPETLVMGASSPLSFDGRMTNGVMTGVVEDSGKKLPFRLDLATKIDLSRYTGNYQVAPGHFISIVPSYPPVWLVASDIQSGQGAVLFPRSDADFVCGSGFKLYPAQVAIHFTTNQLGEVTTFEWKPKNGPTLAGSRIKALGDENVSFTNGDVTLSGTLVLPPSKGPHPAVVILLGSSAWVRNEAESIAQFFALNGVAALMYDKRGCGRSTGDFSNCSFDDFAGDALAGLELLKNRQDISPHQIGLWGASEGGWIVSLAASRCADVAFIVNMSGPGVSPEATSAYQVEHWMKAAGYSKSGCCRSAFIFPVERSLRADGEQWECGGNRA